MLSQIQAAPLLRTPGSERQAANRLLERHWAGRSLPVNPFLIAQEMALQVSPFFLAAAAHDASTGTLRFDPSLPFPVQCQALAQVLGHRLLNPDTSIELHVDLLLSGGDAHQAWARRFADDLLLPRGSVELMIVDKGLTDIDVIARHFGATPAHMVRRLKALSYLS